MNFKDINNFEKAQEFGNDTSLAECFLQIKNYIDREVFLLKDILNRLELKHSNHVSYTFRDFDALEERYDQFKIGWVYENGEKNRMLVYRIIKKENCQYPIFAVSLDFDVFICRSYTLEGIMWEEQRDTPYNLDISTGRPWEPEND